MAKRGRRKGRVRSVAAGGIDLMRYAVAGARARLEELAQEAGDLFRHFPQLRSESPSPWGIGTPGTATRSRGRGRSAGSSATGTPQRRRRRRTMSAEARARISAAQKKRWAEQRKNASKAAKAR